MANTDIKYRDFEGVTFNGRHSSEFHLVRTSDGDRYQIGLIPSSQHQTVDMPGKDGSYYYGKKDESRNFSLKFAFDELTELDIRKIRQWLSVDEPVSLIFDEWPYKVYYVMPEGEPVVETICFNKPDGSRVYKGEVEINMIAYYPYARSQSKRLIDYDAAIVAGRREFEMGDNIVERWYEDFDKYITRIDTEVFTRTEGLPYPFLTTLKKGYLWGMVNDGTDLSFPSYAYCITEDSDLENVKEIFLFKQNTQNAENYTYIGIGVKDTNGYKVSRNSVYTYYSNNIPSSNFSIASKITNLQYEHYTVLPSAIGQYTNPVSTKIKTSSFYQSVTEENVNSSAPSIETKLYLNSIDNNNYMGIVVNSSSCIINDNQYVPIAMTITFYDIDNKSVGYIDLGKSETSFTDINGALNCGVGVFTDSNGRSINNRNINFMNPKEKQPIVSQISNELNTISIEFVYNEKAPVSYNVHVIYATPTGRQTPPSFRYDEDNKKWMWKNNYYQSSDYYILNQKIELEEDFVFKDEALARLETPPSLVPSITKINEWNLFNKHPDFGNEFSIKREDGVYQNYYDFESSPPSFVKQSAYFFQKKDFEQENDCYKGLRFEISKADYDFFGRNPDWNENFSLWPKLSTDLFGLFTRIPAWPENSNNYGDQVFYTWKDTSSGKFFVFLCFNITIFDNYMSVLASQTGVNFYYYSDNPFSIQIEKYTGEDELYYWPINYFYENRGVKFPLWYNNNYISSEAPFSKIHIDARNKQTFSNSKEWTEASGIIDNPIEKLPPYDKYENRKIHIYNPGDIPAPYKIKYNLNLAGKNSSNMLDLISLNNDYSLYWSLGSLDQTSIKLTADTRAALLNRVNFIDFNSLSPNYYLVNEYDRIQNLKYDGRWYSQMPLQKISFEKDTDLVLILSLSDGLAKETKLWTHAKINFYRISDNINYNSPAKTFQITPEEAVSTNNRQFSISRTVPKGNYLMSIQCFFKKSEGAPAGWGSNPEKNYVWKEQDIDKYYQLYLFENNKESNDNYITGQICFDSDKQSIYWTSDTRREVLLEDILEEGKYLPIPVTNFFLDEQANETIDMTFRFWKKNGTVRTEIGDIGEIGLDTTNPVEIEYDYLYY